MAPRKTPKAGPGLDPPFATVYSGLTQRFTFTVDGKPRRADEVEWKVTRPDVGRVDRSGVFTAFEGYRHPRTEVVATLPDGKTLTAPISILVGPPPGDVHLVDDYSLHGFFQSTPWNDRHGRRAVLLMIETLWQLPPQFLRAVGQVAVVRVPTLTRERNPAWVTRGLHLPFLRRAILISDEDTVQRLDPEAGEFTDEDRRFVQTFIHELAHVALANEAIPYWERLALIVGLHAALVGAPFTQGVPLAVLAGAVYTRYYSPVAPHDLVSEYAKVTGWVVNNPNPLSFLWNDTTALPNAVTGLALLGKHVGLRNRNRPILPILFGPDGKHVPLSDDEIERMYRQKGFATSYAGTDVHEDFADALAAIALHEPVASTPAFAARREFIVRKGFWPETWDPVKPGAVLDRWAKDNGRPLPNVYEWAVHFGNFAGRLRNPNRLVIQPPLKPRKLPPGGSPVTISAMAVGETDPESPAREEPAQVGAPGDPDAWMGEGGGGEYSWDEETGEALRMYQALEEVSAHQEAHSEVLEPALVRAREEIAALEVPLREGTVLELLRTAECHGGGVLFLGAKGVAEAEDAIELPEVRAEPGDLVVADGGTVYVVVRADAEGRIRQLAGEPEITEAGKVRPLAVRGKSLRYHWRPARERRRWAEPGAPRGEYADLDAALVHLVRLWGRTEAERGRDLSVAGNLAAEVLDAAGIRHRGLRDRDRDGVHEYLDGFGEGVRPFGKEDSPEPAVGDLVRLRREGFWGVCTRVHGPGLALDVLFQGGLRGHAGEEEDAVTLQHAVEPGRIGHLWRPSGTRRP